MRDLAQLTDVLQSLKLHARPLRRAARHDRRGPGVLDAGMGRRTNCKRNPREHRRSPATCSASAVPCCRAISSCPRACARRSSCRRRASSCIRTRPRSSAGRWRTRIRAEGYGDVSQIVSPAVGGIIPGYETARHLGVPADLHRAGQRRVRAAPRLRDRAGREGDRGRGHRLDRRSRSASASRRSARSAPTWWPRPA